MIALIPTSGKDDAEEVHTHHMNAYLPQTEPLQKWPPRH